MAEFQWWLLLVGLVAGGGIVAVVTMDGRRREEDLAGLERRAEATWIAERSADRGSPVPADVVEDLLGLHRQYLGLPPPDELIVEGQVMDDAVDDPLDRDPDRMPDDVGDDRRERADEDLAAAREEQAAPGEEAHPGSDGEQRPDR